MRKERQCSNSGRKRNDIDPLESDLIVQPSSPLEFPGSLTPQPLWNFQFPPGSESGYFLEPHNVETFRCLSNFLICLVVNIASVVYLNNLEYFC